MYFFFASKSMVENVVLKNNISNLEVQYNFVILNKNIQIIITQIRKCEQYIHLFIPKQNIPLSSNELFRYSTKKTIYLLKILFM